MEVLEQNEHKYSRKKFEGYKFRAKFEFDVKDQLYTSNIDIYTTDEDKSRVHKTIADKTTDKVFSLNIIHWTTKEQDDLISELLTEI